jgi:hypothetical protein
MRRGVRVFYKNGRRCPAVRAEIITYLKNEPAPLLDVAQLIFPDMRSTGRNNEPEIPSDFSIVAARL